MLGVVPLYVGAVLVINGLWLIGEARAAAAGRGAAMEAEAHPLFTQGREVTVINIFTGFVGVVAAVTLMVQGNPDNDLASIRGGGLILLFAFTYLWVAVNGVPQRRRSCLRVVVPLRGDHRASRRQLIVQQRERQRRLDLSRGLLVRVGDPSFFVLLTLDRPIGRITEAWR